MHFGEHITIDGYGGSFEKLNDKNTVLKSLSELVEKIGMHPMAGPFVYKAEANDKKDPGGWTGFVVIQESHISIHTFPARGFVSADVYSCRNGLSQKIIADYFKSSFELKKIEKHFIKRGKFYPKDNIF